MIGDTITPPYIVGTLFLYREFGNALSNATKLSMQKPPLNIRLCFVYSIILAKLIPQRYLCLLACKNASFWFVRFYIFCHTFGQTKQTTTRRNKKSFGYRTVSSHPRLLKTVYIIRFCRHFQTRVCLLCN